MSGIFRFIKAWLRNNVEMEKRLKDLYRKTRNIDVLTLDKAAEIIAGLGVPGLVLTLMIALSPWFGAAAITSSLAALGPFGMLGGIATLGVLAFISRVVAEFGVEIFFQRVLAKLIEGGETCEEILEKIDGYPISKELKRKLREFIEKFAKE